MIRMMLKKTLKVFLFAVLTTIASVSFVHSAKASWPVTPEPYVKATAEQDIVDGRAWVKNKREETAIAAARKDAGRLDLTEAKALSTPTAAVDRIQKAICILTNRTLDKIDLYLSVIGDVNRIIDQFQAAEDKGDLAASKFPGAGKAVQSAQAMVKTLFNLLDFGSITRKTLLNKRAIFLLKDRSGDKVQEPFEVSFTEHRKSGLLKLLPGIKTSYVGQTFSGNEVSELKTLFTELANSSDYEDRDPFVDTDAFDEHYNPE